MNRVVTHFFACALGIGIGVWLTSHSTELAASKQDQSHAPRGTVQTPSSFATSSSPQHDSANRDAGSQSATSASRREGINSLKEEFDNLLGHDDLDGASSILARMETNFSQSLEYLESKSRLLVRQRNWEEAKAVLEQCVSSYPASKTCLIDLSSTVLSIGSKEEQDKAITSCLNLSPNDLECRNMQAILRMNQGKYVDAVAIYRQLLKDNGSFGVRFEDSMLNWQLGIALEGAGDLREAMSYFEKACRSNYPSSCKKSEDLRTQLQSN
jgi:tetratricopeptide (TPR) repeat protein